jgi:SOS-response transcriptional repressor LexA
MENKKEGMNWKETKLKAGETFITSEKGNSMTPIIKSGQDHKLAPVKIEEVKVGDIVFCKVRGKYYTHFVKAKSDKGCLIGNNKGGINGWSKQIFGKVVEVL